MKITIQDFFKPIHLLCHPSSYDYGKMKPYIRFAETLSHVAYHSIYLVDYYRRGFLYVSDNPLFLCGKPAKQVLQDGYLFYLKNVPNEDLELLLKINEAGFEFYNSIPLANRLDYSISYDFRLKQGNNHLTLINHKLAPLVLDEDGNIWIALCVVSLSSNSKPGNITIKNAIEKKVFEYNLFSKKWIPKKIVTLNSREKQILTLSIQGFTVEGISKELYLSVNTIKFHRKNFFKKLKATSISEAIFAAVNYGLM